MEEIVQPCAGLESTGTRSGGLHLRGNVRPGLVEHGLVGPSFVPPPPVMGSLVLDARAELKEAGHGHGPLSVVVKLSRLGFTPPSRATVARIFSRAGVVVPEPRKKPRSAYKRVAAECGLANRLDRVAACRPDEGSSLPAHR